MFRRFAQEQQLPLGLFDLQHAMPRSPRSTPIKLGDRDPLVAGA
jgi:hypothetical protein